MSYKSMNKKLGTQFDTNVMFDIFGFHSVDKRMAFFEF